MKDISAGLQAHLRGELTTLAELVKITRRDGAVVAMTTHDVDIVYDGVTYKADASFSPTVFSQSAMKKDDDYEIEGVLDSSCLDESDIEKGLYDHARIDVFVCNWADLSQGVLRLRRGWLGEIVLREGRYTASLRGFHDLLAQKTGEAYAPSCRYDLGDGRCGVDLVALKVVGAVTSLSGRQVFCDIARGEAAGTFNDAVLTWTSGANAGARMEVYKWDLDTRTFTLWLPMEEDIKIGDAYEVAPGCDKRFSTCRGRFNNGLNFGGFPYMPGIGKILDYPDAR